MTTEKSIDKLVDRINFDLVRLENMVDELDPSTTNWKQIEEYLTWVKLKMLGVYRMECDERILDQLYMVDHIIRRIQGKFEHVNDL